MRKVGPRARALLHEFEQCRLQAYMPTPKDRPTIGWGNTFYPDGRPVQMGDVITQAQADEIFAIWLQRFSEKVDRLLGAAPTTPAQFGAMVCLAYNIGIEGFARSSVLRFHLAGDYENAALAFRRWNKQKGRVLRGLVRRRAAEEALYRGQL